jgi:hypothetical protein
VDKNLAAAANRVLDNAVAAKVYSLLPAGDRPVRVANPGFKVKWTDIPCSISQILPDLSHLIAKIALTET